MECQKWSKNNLDTLSTLSGLAWTLAIDITNNWSVINSKATGQSTMADQQLPITSVENFPKLYHPNSPKSPIFSIDPSLGISGVEKNQLRT